MSMHADAPEFIPCHMPALGYTTGPRDIVIWRWWCFFCESMQNMLHGDVCRQCRMAFSYDSTPHAHLLLLQDGRRSGVAWHNNEALTLLKGQLDAQQAYEVEVRSALFLDAAVHAVVRHGADLDAAFDRALAQVADVLLHHAEQVQRRKERLARIEWDRRVLAALQDEDQTPPSVVAKAAERLGYLTVSRDNPAAGESPLERGCDMGVLAWEAVTPAQFVHMTPGVAQAAQARCVLGGGDFSPPGQAVNMEGDCGPDCNVHSWLAARLPPAVAPSSEETREETTNNGAGDKGKGRADAPARRPLPPATAVPRTDAVSREVRPPPTAVPKTDATRCESWLTSTSLSGQTGERQLSLDPCAVRKQSRWDFARPSRFGAVGDGRPSPSAANRAGAAATGSGSRSAGDPDATGSGSGQGSGSAPDRRIRRRAAPELPAIAEVSRREEKAAEQQAQRATTPTAPPAPRGFRSWVPIVPIGANPQGSRRNSVADKKKK